MSKRPYVIAETHDGHPVWYLSRYEATEMNVDRVGWNEKPENAMAFMKPDAESLAFRIAVRFPEFIGVLMLRRRKIPKEPAP